MHSCEELDFFSIFVRVFFLWLTALLAWFCVREFLASPHSPCFALLPNEWGFGVGRVRCTVSLSIIYVYVSMPPRKFVIVFLFFLSSLFSIKETM